MITFQNQHDTVSIEQFVRILDDSNVVQPNHSLRYLLSRSRNSHYDDALYGCALAWFQCLLATAPDITRMCELLVLSYERYCISEARPEMCKPVNEKLGEAYGKVLQSPGVNFDDDTKYIDVMYDVDRDGEVFLKALIDRDDISRADKLCVMEWLMSCFFAHNSTSPNLQYTTPMERTCKAIAEWMTYDEFVDFVTNDEFKFCNPVYKRGREDHEMHEPAGEGADDALWFHSELSNEAHFSVQIMEMFVEYNTSITVNQRFEAFKLVYGDEYTEPLELWCARIKRDYDMYRELRDLTPVEQEAYDIATNYLTITR